jgi:hypothetical protein
MPNFVLIYKGGRMAETEAEREQVMAAWGKWFGRLGPAVVDGGNPFAASSAIAPDGRVSQPAPSALTGYSVVSADDLGAAVEMGKGCPVLASGGSVEVYETFPVM